MVLSGGLVGGGGDCTGARSTQEPGRSRRGRLQSRGTGRLLISHEYATGKPPQSHTDEKNTAWCLYYSPFATLFVGGNNVLCRPEDSIQNNTPYSSNLEEPPQLLLAARDLFSAYVVGGKLEVELGWPICCSWTFTRRVGPGLTARDRMLGA
jgi:hypothetical protein